MSERAKALEIAQKVIDEYARQTGDVLDDQVLVEAMGSAGLLARTPSPEREALHELYHALRDRHHGRMPDEVQAAYDRAADLLRTPSPCPHTTGLVGTMRVEDGAAVAIQCADCREWIDPLTREPISPPAPAGNAVVKVVEGRDGFQVELHTPYLWLRGGHAMKDEAAEQAAGDLRARLRSSPAPAEGVLCSRCGMALSSSVHDLTSGAGSHEFIP